MVLKFFGFLLVGLFLLWLIYKDWDMKKLLEGLSKIDFGWLGIAMIIAMISHFLRAVRWKLMIEGMGHKVKTFNIFLSVLIMYLANYAIPRMGEITRCGIVRKYENVPIPKLIGSVIIERTSDMFFLLALVLLMLITQMPVLIEFLSNNPKVHENFIKMKPYLFIFLIASIIGISFLWLIRKKVKQSFLYKKVEKTVKGFKEGLMSILTMKRKWEFIFYSLGIWLLYLITLYLSFKAFEPTVGLPFAAALSGLVLGSFGMVAPVQGGIGAWHFMIINTLVIYGISTPDGEMFALLAHGSQMILLVLAGFVALLILPIYNLKYKRTKENTDQQSDLAETTTTAF